MIALLPDMAIFVRVVELGSFTAAANSVGQTPSAVSRQVARLERAFETRLLQRSTRKLQLTEAGRAVFDRCVQMLESAYAAADVVGKFVEKPRGLVRASAPMTFGKIVISPLVPSFLREFSEVDVQLLLTDRHVDPIVDSMDLIIRITNKPDPGLAGRPLIFVRYVLCASASYLERFGVPEHPEQIAVHPCLFFGDDLSDARWQFQKGREHAVVQVRGRFIVNHSEAMLEAVQNSVGIGFLPFFTARRALEASLVRQVLPDWKIKSPYQGNAWVLFSPNRHLPPKTRAFLDHLLAHVSRHA